MNDELREADLPGTEPFDDRVVRRAVLRGLLRTGLVATTWLAILLMLIGVASVGISAHRGPGFHALAFNGLRMAHPEYEISQESSCCATGPLNGLTNLGLVNSMTLRLTPVGALNYPGSATITVEQGVTGGIDPGIDGNLPPTPLREALGRGRPDAESTAGYLAALPEPTVVSALVEFSSPLAEPAFADFFDTSVPATEVPYRSVPVFLVDPYASRSGAPISWPNLDLGELRDWADRLDSGDDPGLRQLGLPPAAEIRQTSDAGRVHAFVAPELPLRLLRELINDPAVRGVRVLDVAFATALPDPPPAD